MPEIIRLFNMDYSKVQKLTIQWKVFQNNLQINATGEVNGRVESMQKQVALSEGRVFVPCSVLSDCLLLTRQQSSKTDVAFTADYHGKICLGRRNSKRRPKPLLNRFLTAVEIKNLFNHPCVVEAHERNPYLLFYSEAVDLYRKVVKFWLRSNTIANSESSILLIFPAPIQGWP
jgi:hypothetical protein